MKSLLVIFAVLIVGFIFIVVWDLSSNSTVDKTDYNEISWRVPSDKEIKKVEDSFTSSDIDGCPTFFIKKFEGEKYLIACDAKDGSWDYYTAYATQKKAYRTPRELAMSLLPPEILKAKQEQDPAKRESDTPGKTVSPRDTRFGK